LIYFVKNSIVSIQENGYLDKINKFGGLHMKKEITVEEVITIISPICLAYKNEHHNYDGELPDVDDLEKRLILSNLLERALRRHQLLVTVPHPLWGFRKINDLAKKITQHLNSTGIKRIKPLASILTIEEIKKMAAAVVRYCSECHQAYDHTGHCACYYERINFLVDGPDELDLDIDAHLKKMGQEKKQDANIVSMFPNSEV